LLLAKPHVSISSLATTLDGNLIKKLEYDPVEHLEHSKMDDGQGNLFTWHTSKMNYQQKIAELLDRNWAVQPNLEDSTHITQHCRTML
jgi:hypothetical protein